VDRVIEIYKTAERILAQQPDPVVRFRLLQDVLHRPAGDQQLALAADQRDASHQVQQLQDEQWQDGSWGRLHTQDHATAQRVPTTEAGVERALALGLDGTHPVLRHAASYLIGVLKGRTPCRDRPEKNDRWETGVRLFAAATLASFEPHLPALDELWHLWNGIAQRTFASGAYDPEAEIRAHRECTGASVKGSYLVIDNKYALALLASRLAALPSAVESTLVQWLWHKDDGIGYLREPLSQPPRAMKAGPLERWLASQELLSGFPSWRSVAEGVVSWLWEQRTPDGWWDFGSRATVSVVLPLSETWRRQGARRVDWTTRVLILLRRYQADDELLLLPSVAELERGQLYPVPPCAGVSERYIIRTIRLAHCKRGPAVCEKCREMDVERICLLDICPPDAGEMQRRVISITRDGQPAWREFDIVRIFASPEAARGYAQQNGITDIEL
jgi:hypothetical protein